MSNSPGNLLMVLKRATEMLVEQQDGDRSDGPASVDQVVYKRKRTDLLCKQTFKEAPDPLHNVSCANQLV